MDSQTDKVTYRYNFRRHVPIDDIQDTLTLAILGAENLHGRARIRLDGSWRLDRQRRTCVIDASTQVGQDIARLFTGYVAREFGERAFSVRHRGNAGQLGKDQSQHNSSQGAHRV